MAKHETTLCAADGCGVQRMYGRKWCGYHRYRHRAGLPLDKMAPVRREQCVIEGCEMPPRGYKEHCEFHARRLRDGVPLDKPRKKPKRLRSEILFRDSQGLKQCYECGEWLPESEFWALAANADGLQYACKSCLYLMKVAAKYNKTAEWYKETLARYNGICPLCNKATDQWHIDHDHTCCAGDASCGKCVRGIICATCNRGIGYMQDDPAALRRAAEYLERHCA